MTVDDRRLPIAAAQSLLRTYVEAREQIDELAAGFALLDFVQGALPPMTLDAVVTIAAVVRGEGAATSDPLVERWYWVYASAYRNLQRALHDGTSFS